MGGGSAQFFFPQFFRPLGNLLPQSSSLTMCYLRWFCTTAPALSLPRPAALPVLAFVPCSLLPCSPPPKIPVTKPPFPSPHPHPKPCPLSHLPCKYVLQHGLKPFAGGHGGAGSGRRQQQWRAAEYCTMQHLWQCPFVFPLLHARMHMSCPVCVSSNRSPAIVTRRSYYMLPALYTNNIIIYRKRRVSSCSVSVFFILL